MAGVFCWPPRSDFVDGWFQKIADRGSAGQVEASESLRGSVSKQKRKIYRFKQFESGGCCTFVFSDLDLRCLSQDQVAYSRTLPVPVISVCGGNSSTSWNQETSATAVTNIK